jgi:hypothetical protein
MTGRLTRQRQFWRRRAAERAAGMTAGMASPGRPEHARPLHRTTRYLARLSIREQAEHIIESGASVTYHVHYMRVSWPDDDPSWAAVVLPNSVARWDYFQRVGITIIGAPKTIVEDTPPHDPALEFIASEV